MMSEARFKAVYGGLSSIAKKVYEATPIATQWTATEIGREMGRTGVGGDIKVIQGCLNTLIQAGLVTEPERAKFIRSPIRRPLTIQKESATTTIETEPTPEEITLPKLTTPASNALDALTTLMVEAEKLSKDLKRLSDGITNAVVEIEETMAKDKADLAKLRQLQGLLKELG